MSELRKAIIEQLKSQNGERYYTWWFRHYANIPTLVARRELKKMEAEGIVIADRDRPNSTGWRMAPHQTGESE